MWVLLNKTMEQISREEHEKWNTKKKRNKKKDEKKVKHVDALKEAMGKAKREKKKSKEKGKKKLLVKRKSKLSEQLVKRNLGSIGSVRDVCWDADVFNFFAGEATKRKSE